LPDRTFVARNTSGTADLARATDVLLDPALAHVVELVVWRSGPDELTVANAAGACVLDRDSGRVVLRGDDPLARQDALAFSGTASDGRPEELGDPQPTAARNHYPLAGPRLWSAFSDAERCPDIAVVHADGHHWPEQGGHLGEHGSLSVLQSRAPFLLSGPGVAARGVLDDAARIVDVAPTLLTLAGLPVPPGLDGRARTDLAAGGPGAGARHTIGLLWDGANCSAVLAGAADGSLPNVARLLDRGCALRGGAVAEFPSVTLVNHASALTGLGPGRHGIVNNAFYERSSGRQVLANDATTWHLACDLLRPGAATLWEMAGPDVDSACVNEPIDRGASYSTFALVRASGSGQGARSFRDSLPAATEDPYASQEWVRSSPDYAWATQVDALGLQQLLALLDRPEFPRLIWANTTLTDTGHHGGGAHSPEASASLRDADRRLGVLLDGLADRALLEHTAFLLTADHGSVAADPACRGDWDEALATAGVAVRDEAYGFLYLGL